MLFDDLENIASNDYLRIKDLGYSSLRNAAFSSEAGVFGRPIPMLSFAFNFYFNHNSTSAFPFKLTNILIHSLNGILVFWFFYLGLERLSSSEDKFSELSSRQIFFLAFGAATLWTAHPIHLTSVLYIVQRMTSLSATFVLLALISYILGRISVITGNRWRGGIYIVGGTALFGLLGLLSKENAALLPVFIAIVELTLFPNEWPWTTWSRLSRHVKYLVIAGLCLTGIAALAYLVSYSYPGYTSRPFSFSERLLTEPRVLLFYLSLIFLPRIEAFGIYHDDITISSNLLEPWTTLPSIIAIGLLITIAALSYRNHKLISFSILWFFASHLMESTIIALELAHEHRNYLATVGPVVLIMYLTYLAIRETRRKRLWWIPGLLLILFVTNTSLRAWHWSDKASLYDFESRNHPNSARAQASMGSLFAEIGKLEEAKQAFKRASALRPYDASDLINIRIIQSWQNIEPTDKSRRDVLARVKYGLRTPLTNQVLDYAVNCLPRNCNLMRDELLAWLPIYISRSGENSRQRAHYNYLYAQTLLYSNDTSAAIFALRLAIKSYKYHLPPYFLLLNIYLERNKIGQAVAILEQLKKVNTNSRHPRDREIEYISDKIQLLRDATSRKSLG